jgi:ABC-type multidrug transport system ATPase subunit
VTPISIRCSAVDGRGAVLMLADVGHRFGRRSWVLNGIDLALRPGTVTLVVGANGSGKSTLLRIACGLQVPTAGRVGRHASSVAYAPDRLSSRTRMTARTYLEHVARLRRLDEDVAREDAARLGEELAVVPGLDVAMRDLSKGNAQKVALIQALLAPVDAVVLDEPYSGLDGAARGAAARAILRHADRGAAVLVAAHASLVELRPTVAVRLRAGQLHADEPVSSPTFVRVVLRGADLDTARLEAHQGVVGVARHGDDVALRVASDASDALLALALRDGWSVRSVQPDSSPAGEQG